jgi:LmbE family N-acetylglucosaminyl deacetylase
MLKLLKNKKLLLIVAHPDDELLGVGGTINKLVSEYKTKVKVVILGEGITSRSDLRDSVDWSRQLSEHSSNIKIAQNSIGYQELSTYQLPDNRFDSVDLLDIIKIVEEEKESFKPDYIFTHHGGDLNIDHQKTFEAVMTATRPMANENVMGIVTFETFSGTEWRASSDPKHFIPNLFIEISEKNIEAKIKGMEAYEFEKREYPHPRSPKALQISAQQRGITVGYKLAEAFMIIRLKS